jgi:hypothetical protein
MKIPAIRGAMRRLAARPRRESLRLPRHVSIRALIAVATAGVASFALGAPWSLTSPSPAGADSASGAVVSTDTITNWQQTAWVGNDDGTFPCGGGGNGSPNCPLDGDNGPTKVDLGFNIDFYGNEFSSLYVNNNGNVTFAEPLPQFTPSSLTTFGSPIIAPFFADVDTLGSNSGIVNFGTGTLDGHDVFVVNWPDVGCFENNNAGTNDFQLILIDDPGAGTGPLGDDFEIEFNYNQIEWDTGQDSSGDASCKNASDAGKSAYAGYSNGTTADAFNLPGSGVDNAFLDSPATATSLVSNSNSGTNGRYVYSVVNGTPQSGPSNTGAAPSLSGTTTVGDPLTASPGGWSGSPAPTFKYDFQRCSTDGPSSCTSVQDTGSDTYTLQPGDNGSFYEVIVTATNDAGTASATSATVGPVETSPSNTGAAPSLSGTTQVGDPLTASPGGWSGSPAPTFKYDFQRCSTDGPGSCASVQDTDSDTYTLQPGDAGSFYEVIVTATNDAGSASATSATVGPVNEPPTNTGTAPSIGGSATVGGTLTANPGGWSGYPTVSFSYEWQACFGATCSDVETGANNEFSPVVADEGATIQVILRATNTVSPDAQVTVGPTAAVTGPPVNGVSPSIGGSATVGGTLTADPGSWSGYPAPTFSYEWQACFGATCSDVETGANNQYSPVVADEGATIQVIVVATNHISPDGRATAGPTAAVTGAPVNGTAPSIGGDPTVGGTLTADPGTWSGYPTPTFTYTFQDCTGSSGTGCSNTQTGSSNQYHPVAGDAGLFVRVIVTATNSVAPEGVSADSATTTTAVTEAPTNTQVPTIPGTAQQDTQLTGSAGIWGGVPTPTLTYQWQDCNSAGNNCSSVAANGNSLTYTPTSLDVGQTLRLSVTATNSAGHLTVASNPTAAVLIAPPANTGVPTITGSASAQQGVQLTATNGSWTNSPTSFSYHWFSCDASGNNCATTGSDSQTYTPGANDVGGTIHVTVTAINNGGSASATSTQTATVLIGAPESTSPPAISGTAQPGQTLNASTGTWDNSPSSFSYQWLRCDGSGANCQPLSAPTGDSYLIATSDIGSSFRVVVTATNAGGHASSAGGPSDEVTIAAPVNDTLPSIGGTAQQGDTLTASPGTWVNDPSSFLYQWQQCDASGNGCSNIQSATTATYVPGTGDVGHALTVIVTAHNSTGNTPASSAATAAVLIAPPANTDPPQVSGTPVQGEALNGTPGAWNNSPSTYAYQWYQCDASGANCGPIMGANQSSYTPAVTDIGHTLRLVVTVTNSGGTTTATSGPSAVIAGLGASIPPPILQQSADLNPVSGTVLIKLPGSDNFVPLTNPLDVPIGSTIDATNGTVSLTVQLADGSFQTGQFYSGEFTVGQAKSGTVDAELAGGSFAGCKANKKHKKKKHKKHGARAAGSSKKPNTVVRQLWGNAHGNYTTKGRYGSASVSGTIWLTQDRCDGTFFKALKDDVYVVAFAHPHKRHHLMQGQTILIPSP